MLLSGLSANTTRPIPRTAWWRQSWSCAEPNPPAYRRRRSEDCRTRRRTKAVVDRRSQLADDLSAVWSATTTDPRLKKRIARTVIHQVIADIDTDAGEIVLLLHWMSGTHTELRLPRRRRGQRNSTAPDVIDAVRQLVLVADDDMIAGFLNLNKLTTGLGNRWTRERVTSLRSHHKIPVHRAAENGVEPWLNLTKNAAHLGVSAKTLKHCRRKRRGRSPAPASRRPLDLQPCCA
jgi:hypothetical protein